MPFSGSVMGELAFLFVISFLTPSFNIILPFKPIMVILALATHLPFLTIALVAAVGATLGELPMYFVGLKIKDASSVKNWIQKHDRWRRFFVLSERSPFLTILFVLWLPLPDQIAGLYGGFERYRLDKFLLANFIGRAVWYIPLAYFGTFLTGMFWVVWNSSLHVIQRIFA